MTLDLEVIDRDWPRPVKYITMKLLHFRAYLEENGQWVPLTWTAVHLWPNPSETFSWHNLRSVQVAILKTLW